MDSEEQNDQQMSEEELFAQWQKMYAEASAEFNSKEKDFKAKFNAMKDKIGMSGQTKFSKQDRDLIKDAKKHRKKYLREWGLKSKINQHIRKVKMALLKNQIKVKMKAMSSMPLVFKIFLLVFLIFLIICACVIVASAVGGSESEKPNSMNGVTGKDFYGIRMVYKDDEKAVTSMIEDYIEVVEAGILRAEFKGLTGNVRVEINFVLPDEEYNFETFNEDEFATNYPLLYSTIKEIANVVHENDLESASTGTLIETVEAIPYFGIVQVDKDSDSNDDITKIVEDAILSVSTFVPNTTDPSATITQTEIDESKAAISQGLKELYASEKYTKRTDKLFMKDYILEDETRVSNLSKENYVALIFMPKTDVNFNGFSFMVRDADINNFKISMKANGQEISLETDGENIAVTEGATAYIYFSDEVNVNSSEFEGINSEDLTIFEDGVSLFDVVENNSLTTENVLESYTTEDSLVLWTFKQEGVVVLTESEQEFYVVEWETAWKTAS